MKKWNVLSSDVDAVKNFITKTDLSPLTAHIMSARGYNDIESLQSFFDPIELDDPFILKDMDKAVDVINSAIDSGETICIYGDYDCDGVTSSAILYDYLRNMGAQVMCYIPERSEGYGLNKNAIDEINSLDASLIITVDNGISAVEEAKYIKELGIKLVITDHHQPSEVIPDADAVVDPHRKDCPSEFKGLAGVGVTLKLIAALDGGEYDLVLDQYADIAAVGTIADVVPLVSENRAIVSKGLKLFENTDNLGLISLLEESGAKAENITASDVAFTLSPRINASGRFGSPITALDLLVAEDEESAKDFAHQLSTLNDQRKKAEADISLEIYNSIKNDPSITDQRVMVVAGDGWHHGVIGIVAARLLEAYEKPVIVISKDADGCARGSARSIKGFNVFKCFEYCKDALVKYGGHECAGGLTVKNDNIARLNALIQEYAAINHPQMPRYTLTADKLVRGTDLKAEYIADLKRLEPCGCENSEPLFAFSGAKIISVVPLKGGDHTRLDLEYDGVKLKALMFRKKTSSLDIVAGDIVDLMGKLELNTYNGITSISLIVSDYRLHGIKQDRYFAAMDAYYAYRRGEDIKKEYLQRALPTREELVALYKYISNSKFELNAESLYARTSVNGFKLNVMLDAFCETGLMVTDGPKRSIKLVKAVKRVDIMSSETITRLRSML